MTYKTNTKTTIAILAMTMTILAPFTVTGAFAQADQQATIKKVDKKSQFSDWSAENYERFNNNQTAQVQAIVGTYTVTTPACTHYATGSNHCKSYNTSGPFAGAFFYETPRSFITYKSCSTYACADTNVYFLYPSQIVHNGKVYTFSSANSISCAPNMGLCSNTVSWNTGSSKTYTVQNVPTGTPIQFTGTYLYSQGTNQVQIQFTNYLASGYS